jgi:CPA2 family monovalent cation:H+ antiporter-2
MATRKVESSGTLNLPELRITCLRVSSDVPELTGLSISESQIRQKYTVNLMAIQRADETLTEIRPDTRIEKDDLLYVIGRPDSISASNKKLKT